jgi:chemotaxis family two-component system response regulator Rcp1
MKYAYSLPEISEPMNFVPKRRLATYHAARPSWNVLLVEDDLSDVALTKRALRRAYIPHHLHTVASGTEAVKALRGACWPDFIATPDVVLLDLNLPGKSGFELLAEIANLSDPRFHQIPFIILTKLEHYQYITHTYDLWIPSYITKPCTPEKVAEVFAMIGKHQSVKSRGGVRLHRTPVSVSSSKEKQHTPYKWRNTKCKSGIKSRLVWPRSWLS